MASITPPFFAAAAAAQNIDCSDTGNLPQQGLNYCAMQDFEAEDRALNAAWKSVYGELKVRDADLGEAVRGMPEAMLKAQRAWITFRDAHCDTERLKYSGGSIEPLIYNSCRAALTRDRTKQINSLLAE
ncbi:MAG: lysozyme inhibitor LprI family protein [Rhizobiaceae bacterium]